MLVRIVTLEVVSPKICSKITDASSQRSTSDYFQLLLYKESLFLKRPGTLLAYARRLKKLAVLLAGMSAMNTRLRKPKGNRKDGKKFHRRFTVSPKWGTFQARKGKTIPVHLTWNKCYKAATIWQPAFFFFPTDFNRK